jgi:hypothetical protein
MRVRAEETRSFLARKGVQSQGLPLHALSAIGSIQDEKQAVSVAKIAVEKKATGDQVAGVAAKLKTVSSVAEKQKAVREFDASLSASIRNESPSKTVKRPRREKLYRMLESAVQFMEHGNAGLAFGSLGELQCIKSEDHDRLKVLVAKLTIRLNTILEVG